MLAYILSFKDLSIKDILNFREYDFETDIDYTDNSYITVPRKPVIDNKDFVWCKDGNETVFTGICDTYTTQSDDEGYTINMRQKEQYFSRQIFIGDEAVKRETGIEDFIAAEIKKNWIDSGDPVMDIGYLSVVAVTHTPVQASVTSTVTTESPGVYNLKSYLGNCKELYQIYTDFVFSGRTLTVRIYRKSDPVLPIDIKVSDITEYDESYDVNVMARVMVHWKIPDTINEDGTVSVGAESYRAFYLKSDRTTTEDINDPDRIDGTSTSIYVEAETEGDMRQQALNEFAGNRYNHQVNFKLKKKSMLYGVEDYYVGRVCRFKSKTGIQETLITAIKDGSDSDLLWVTFGKLKVTLIEKLRRFYA